MDTATAEPIQQPAQQAPGTAAPAAGDQASFASPVSLYVGDLAPDVAEAALLDIFTPIAPVASIRVCRDAITRRSLGYAYVNFGNHADAQKAMDTLDNTDIKGRACRIMWSQRDPSLRKSGKNNVFIKNLSKDIDRKALCDTFKKFGPILSCKIELDHKGESKGYGFIQFESVDSAEKAIDKLDGKILNGKKVYVGKFIPKKERIAQSGSQRFTNIFVKNLDESITDEKLKELFSSYGSIKSAIVMIDENGKSRGFGFVDFEEPQDAAEAVDNMKETEVAGKVVYVGRAQKKYEREAELRSKFEQMKMERLSKFQGANLYVKNLEDDVTDDKLRELFSPYGTITSAVVKRDNKNVSKGFGFVCFSTPEEATKAVQELSGKIVGTKPLYVALHQPKDQRKAQLESVFASRNKMHPARMGGGMPMGMHPNGTPMFYAPGPAVPGYPYPMQMAPAGRGRFVQPYGAPMPAGNYVMIPGGRGGAGKANPGGRGNVMVRRKGGNVMMPMQGQQPQQPAGQQPQQPQQQQQPQQPAGSMEIMASALVNYPADTQKAIVGEQLYPKIQRTQPHLAGKITGMILDSCAIEEILPMLEKSELLDEKIDEALQALREHQASAKNNEQQ